MSDRPESPQSLITDSCGDPTRRRLVIGGLAVASGVLGAAALRSDSAGHFLARARIAADRLYDEIQDSRRSQTRSLKDESAYRAFLSSLSLRYLSADEIIRPHRNIRDGVANEIPPRHMWKRLIPTLKVADEIRHRLGSPLHLINSAYRSPHYNLACSGAKHSYHLQNRALDLIFKAGPEAASEVAQQLRKEGFFRGGIGTYPGFIHVDTRGFDASWGT